MGRIAVLIDRALIQQEGRRAESSVYRDSSHLDGSRRILRMFKQMNVKAVVWGPDDLSSEAIAGSDVTAVVVGDMRVCPEETFERLMRLAESGLTVLAGVDSFTFALRPDGTTVAALPARIRQLGELDDQADVRSLYVAQGALQFDEGAYGWLTRGLPETIPINKGCRALAALELGPAFQGHGQMRLDEPRADVAVGPIEEAFQGVTVPAFLIREYEGGGQFIYACFSPRDLGLYRPLLDNLVQAGEGRYKDIPKLERELRALRTVMLLLSLVIGFLIAGQLATDTATRVIGGFALGIVVGVAANMLSAVVVRYLKG